MLTWYMVSFGPNTWPKLLCAVKAVTHLARFLCDSDWLLIVFYSHTFQKTFSDLVYFPTNLLLAA